MEVLYLLIPVSLVIVFIAIWFFIRMSKSGQFDDMEGPAYRILLDDDLPGGRDDEAGHTPSTPDAQH